MQTTTPQAGEAGAELVEVRPALGAEHREVDDDRVEPHRDQRVQRHRRGEHAVRPAHAFQALAEHLQEAGIRIDHRQADAGLPWSGELPLLPRDRGFTCPFIRRQTICQSVSLRDRKPPR